MTVLHPPSGADTWPDPFVLEPPGETPARPRLLSYVGRWGRARRWLGPTALRVLDVGCAFGYGSAAVAVCGPTGRVVIGVERDPKLLAQGRNRYPWLRIIDADATALPLAAGCADAVLLLDVIEHVAEPERVLGEAHRVLRPGGVLVLSVPHAGFSRGLDALNLYQAARRRRPSLPALPASTESEGGPHRHFTPAELRSLVSPWFTVERVARTGLGLQELVTIGLLVIGLPLRAPALAKALFPLHMLVYILDDLLPTGPLAYHLAVRAQAVETGASA